MTSNSRAFCWIELIIAVFALGTAACSKSNSALAPSCTASASSNVVTSSTAAPTGNNVMTITVNGSNCSQSVDSTGALNEQYPNQPCASITICTPGSTSSASAGCATINNLLLDTGSYGLRVFGSVLTAAGIVPTAIISGSGDLAECVGFGDGSSEWGQVSTVDAYLGGEGKVTIPIMVINSNFSTPPSACNSTNSTPDTGPSETMFNGILGVGLFDRDCGPGANDCTTDSQNGQYFSCTGSNCVGTTVPQANQVRNPVAALATDNNGVIMQMPSVPAGGAVSVTGYLTLGIGTESNNQPANVQTYNTDSQGNITSIFNPFSSNPLASFIDSGSNSLGFPWPPASNPNDTTLPGCSSGSGFYCPASQASFAATNIGSGGSPTSCVGFNIASADTLFSGNNAVFSDLAGSSGVDISADFDWGLPFFFGRKVYVGITGKAATGLGTGPYWAY